MLNTVRGALSPEAVLLLALLVARCSTLSRKKRDMLLDQMGQILTAWAEEPLNLKRPADKLAKELALEWFQKELPTLIRE